MPFQVSMPYLYLSEEIQKHMPEEVKDQTKNWKTPGSDLNLQKPTRLLN